MEYEYTNSQSEVFWPYRATSIAGLGSAVTVRFRHLGPVYSKTERASRAVTNPESTFNSHIHGIRQVVAFVCIVRENHVTYRTWYASPPHKALAHTPPCNRGAKHCSSYILTAGIG